MAVAAETSASSMGADDVDVELPSCMEVELECGEYEYDSGALSGVVDRVEEGASSGMGMSGSGGGDGDEWKWGGDGDEQKWKWKWKWDRL